MQSLPSTTNSATSDQCAAALLDHVPGLVWYVRRHMRRHRKGLSIPQFRALVKTQRQAEVSLSCVAEHPGASLPTTSRIVANLVDRGYLTRSESPRDRRQVILRPTARGRAIAEAARKASLKQMAAELGALSSQDRAAVIRALEVFSGFVFGVRQSATASAGGSAVTPPDVARPVRAAVT